MFCFRQFLFTLLLATSFLGSGSAIAQDQDILTPENVIKLVHRAVDTLRKEGSAAIRTMNANLDAKIPASQGGWLLGGEAYLSVTDCVTGINLIHVRESFRGRKDIERARDRSPERKYFLKSMCDIALNQPGGGWDSYLWPKLGERIPKRKFAFVQRWENSFVQVGTHFEDTSVEELNQLARKMADTKAIHETAPEPRPGQVSAETPLSSE